MLTCCGNYCMVSLLSIWQSLRPDYLPTFLGCTESHQGTLTGCRTRRILVFSQGTAYWHPRICSERASHSPASRVWAALTFAFPGTKFAYLTMRHRQARTRKNMELLRRIQRFLMPRSLEFRSEACPNGANIGRVRAPGEGYIRLQETLLGDHDDSHPQEREGVSIEAALCGAIPQKTLTMVNANHKSRQRCGFRRELQPLRKRHGVSGDLHRQTRQEFGLHLGMPPSK